MKDKLHKHLKDILVHDVEAAAFLIVAVSLVATVTTFALDKKEVEKLNKTVYNPQSVEIIDLDSDGFNDMIITHADGHIEHSYSKN